MATGWVIVWQALKGCFWPILLKKSAMVSAAKKYALEINIFTSGKGDWTQISRGGVLNRHFHRSFLWPFLKADFFNSIGRFLPVVVGRSRPEAGHLNDLAQASNHRSLPSTHRHIDTSTHRHIDTSLRAKGFFAAPLGSELLLAASLESQPTDSTAC